MSSSETIGSFVGDCLGNISMVIISGILVFIVLKIVVALLSKFFDNIEKTKVIGGLNKILGLILGIVRPTMSIEEYRYFTDFVWTPFRAGLFTVSINTTAYLTEVLRGGIESLNAGQLEAARSLGMNKTQTMIRIILPQSVKNILPAVGNEYVTVIKETSLASSFYLGELMTVQSLIGTATYLYLDAYIVVAIFYFISTFTLSKLIKMLERRLEVSD